MMIERRSFEFRSIEDGVIEGVVIPYNEEAAIGNFREMFEPGSVRFADVIANRQHIRERPLARTGGGLVLTDSPQSLRASITLPNTVDGNDVRELVRTGVLKGLSAEFRAVRESWRGTLRVIHEAALFGLGVVDKAAYAGATVGEIRENSAMTEPPSRKVLWPYL